jgi:hypothetical protein
MAERRTVAQAPTRALLQHFDQRHQEVLGVRAVIQGGKDAKLLSRLWQSHGEMLVRELIDAFFASDDPWIRQNGYTVGMFISQAGKLIARRARFRPKVIATMDWRDECELIHAGRCTNVHFHEAKKGA